MGLSPETRATARDLRRDGWSLREIASHLRVSLGRTSEWVRDITDEQRRAAPDDAAPPEALPVWSSGRLKRCPRCELALPVEMFGRRAAGLQGWCKPCFRGYHRGRQGAARQRVITRIEKARSFVLAFLVTHPCSDCGITDPVVLEFDHLESKHALVSTLVAHGAAIARISREIARCEVVCVNCHRRRSMHRSGGNRRLGEAFAPSCRRPSVERNYAFLFDELRRCGCVDCGEQDLVVLDFDHVDGKTASVSTLARRECSLARLAEEIARCTVRCANCHRRKTAEEHDYYRFRAGAR